MHIHVRAYLSTFLFVRRMSKLAVSASEYINGVSVQLHVTREIKSKLSQLLTSLIYRVRQAQGGVLFMGISNNHYLLTDEMGRSGCEIFGDIPRE